MIKLKVLFCQIISIGDGKDGGSLKEQKGADSSRKERKKVGLKRFSVVSMMSAVSTVCIKK